MKQAFGSGDRGEFSGSTRFESKDADFSDDILTQISSMPIGIHAASNQSRRMEVMESLSSCRRYFAKPSGRIKSML